MSGFSINRKKLLILVGGVILAGLLVVGVLGYALYWFVDSLPH